MYPSLRFWDDAPRAFVTPALGFGAFIQYKKVSIIAPIYYNSPKNSWIFSSGIAYKLK